MIDTSQFPLPLAGVDEAGRGCLAGPVVAAVTILPDKKTIQNLTDSKKISPSKRAQLEQKIKAESIAWSLGLAWPREIEKVNILQATMYAMSRALEKLNPKPAFVLVDGTFAPEISFASRCVKKGDSLVAEIAAASILAKTFRDRLMRKLSKRYPGYNFAQHKGYATKEHIKLLQKFGPCKMHRCNYKPVKDCFEQNA